MEFKAGERVVAPADSTGHAGRHGAVEEVLRSGSSPRYRIRWDDGHVSSYTPAAGSLQPEASPAPVS